MLLALGVLVLCGAGYLAIRWYLNRYDGLGRVRPFPTISMSVLVIVAAGLVTPTILRHREEERLDKVASVLVGAPATVHCQTFGQTFTDTSGDLGYVKFDSDGVPQHHTTIMRGPCGDLKSYYGGDWARPSPSEIIAVHVLTHESMHMRGQPNEAMAECEAMQRDAETAQLLGATPEEGLKLARAYWIQDYPNMPGGYRTSDCAPGGKLDEQLPDPPWSTGSYVAVKLPE